MGEAIAAYPAGTKTLPKNFDDRLVERSPTPPLFVFQSNGNVLWQVADREMRCISITDYMNA